MSRRAHVQDANDGQIPGGEHGEDPAEEYVVEAIRQHYHDGIQNNYLVKWEGYEDSFDWLPERDLGGAAELLAEYHETLERERRKEKEREKEEEKEMEKEKEKEKEMEMEMETEKVQSS